MFQFEFMESRRLLAATLVGHELQITGTASADEISVWLNKAGTKVMTTVNGVDASFKAKSVREIEIDTFNGDDRVTIASRIRIGADIDGGAGDDYLSGGSGNDDIDGGAGRDTLLGNNGKDELDGGFGVDRITGGSSRDSFDRDDAASELVDYNKKKDNRDD